MIKKTDFFRTWKEVMFNPLNFYNNLPKKKDYKQPSLFYLKVNALVLGVVALILLFVGTILSNIFGAILGQSQVLGNLGFLFFLLIIIILFPILLLISWGSLFLWSGITHLFVLLFGGKQGYKETFNAIAYSQAPTLFSIIPFIGYAAAIYSIILEIIGIKKQQSLDWSRSVAVILIPLVISMALSLVLFFTIFSFIA